MSGATEPSRIVVTRAGLHTTVQDAGRWGYQHVGVPVGGALDLAALHRANALVGNHPDEAGLEVTLVGCALRAVGSACVAVTGARFAVSVNGVSVPQDAAVTLAPGDELVLGRRLHGARAYVAVRGGLDVPLVLGSRSAWPLAPRRGALGDGTVLSIGTGSTGSPRLEPWPTPPFQTTLRVIPAPDASVNADAFEALCAGEYVVASTASRMAYPLDGPAVPLVVPMRPSSGTVHGAIQVLPSGKPVLLMAECQTTGGYPVVGVVFGADLTHAAQVAPGEAIRFVPGTRAEAVLALRQRDGTGGGGSVRG